MTLSSQETPPTTPCPEAPAHDTIVGSRGRGTLNGGPGGDTLDFSGERAALEIWMPDDTSSAYVLFDDRDHRTTRFDADIELVTGGAGDDRLTGNGHANRLRGGPVGRLSPATGNTSTPSVSWAVRTGSGRDRVQAGTGNDTIELLVDGADSIDCGPGRDSVRADGVDRLRNCERVGRS